MNCVTENELMGVWLSLLMFLFVGFWVIFNYLHEIEKLLGERPDSTDAQDKGQVAK